MKLTGNTVLITGGTSGIGLALVERFYKNGNQVITCGRGKAALSELEKRFPDICALRCDVASPQDRESLIGHVLANFPGLNILINNAGIQREIRLEEAERSNLLEEIQINLNAPIDLSAAMIPQLRGKSNAHIVNVSSGLAFLPSVRAPIYDAAKAGLHAFTFSMRLQLEHCGIGVVEIIPPAIDTNLGGMGVHAGAVDVNTFVDWVWECLERGDEEIGFGASLDSRTKPRTQLEAMVKSRFTN